MKWLALTLMVVMAGARTLPNTELKPSETYLKSFTPEQLDSLVEVRLEALKQGIAEGYEDQLRRHHQDLAALEQRAAVALEQEVADQSRFRRGANPKQYWHSYNFDTHRDREMLRIKNITVDQELDILDIDKVIPLNLWNFAAIYRTQTKTGYVLTRGGLRQLLVKNRWTRSLRGCACSRADYQGREDPAPGYEGCACCHRGGCLCPSRPDTCVPCEELSQGACERHKTFPLSLENAAAFQYYLDYFDTEQGLQRVLIAYFGTKLSMYTIDDDAGELSRVGSGIDTQNFEKAVTHLGYGEKYKDVDGHITKERFLFTFAAGEASHRCYSINIQAGFSITLHFWDARGTEMQVWQVDGRVLMAILDHDGLAVKELVQLPRRTMYVLKDLQVIRVAREAPIISWSSFTMASENYLVVVTEGRATVLNLWKNYTHVQDLVPEGGLSAFSAVLPITVPWWRGRAVLVSGQGRQVAAHVWSSTTQRFHLIYMTQLKVNVRDWKKSFAFSDPSRKSFVFVQGDSGPVTLWVDASLEDLGDPVARQIRALHDIIQPLKTEFEDQSRVLEEVRIALRHSVGDKDIIVGNITVLDGINVEGNLSTGILEAERILLESHYPSGRVSRHQYVEDTDTASRYHTLLNTLNQTLVGVHHRLEDAVPVDGSRRVITGRKTILRGGVHVAALSVNRLAVGRPLDARGEPLPLDDILSSIVRYNDTRVITGKKTFLQPLSVGDLKADYLDDIPVSDIVTTRGDHTIAGATTFSRLTAHTVTLAPGHTVAGLDISEQVVTLDGDAALGMCKFEEVRVDALTAISKMINGVDLQRLSSRALTTLGGTVQGSLTFVTPPLIGILNANRIMGVNIANFMSTTVFKHKAATMNGRLTVPSVEVRGDVVVDGLLNGKRFPDDYVVNTGKTIDFGFQWYKEVHFRSLSVGPQCRVDGLLPDTLVTLHTPQTITGLKRFARGVYIEGDLDITSKMIDGINMDTLNSHLTNIKSGSWKFDVVFEHPVSAPSVSCPGTLNGLDWASFVNDLVYDDVPSVVINSSKTFRSGLSLEEAIFRNTFNGESFSNIVNTATLGSSTSQMITGGKTFLNRVSFDTLTTQLVGGVDLKEMADRAVYLNKAGQTVYGVKTFTETLSVKELVVTGSITSLDIDKIVRKSTDQTFTAPQSLRYANFSDLDVISIHMPHGHTINGVDIASLNMKRVSLTSPVYYSGSLTVEGSVSSLAGLTVGTINGYKADELASKFVMKDESSVITGNVRFDALTVDGPVSTHNQSGANGLNISDIGLRAIRLTDDVVMTGGATWDDLFFRNDVAVGGLVSGVNLRELSHNVVYLDQVSSQVITGKKKFAGGLSIQGNLEAKTINSIDLKSRLLTRHTEQVITAPYSFVNVEVKAALRIQGLYNNHNLAGLASLGLSGNGVIQGKVVFHGDVSVGSLHLAGHYNGVDTARHMHDAISLYQSNVTITGPKIFMGNVTFKSVDINTINYVPLKPYLHHVVLKSSNIHFSRTVVVKGTVWAPLVIADSVIVEGSVSGVDYDRMMREAIYLNSNQSIASSLVFTKDIEVQGAIHTALLNSLNLTTQYLTTNTAQSLAATLVLGAASTAQVNVAGLVNSWRLPDEVAATMKAVGGQRVHGHLSLKGVVEVATDVQVTGLVGRDAPLDLSRQAVSLHHNTQIKGLVVFKAPVVTSTLSSGSGVVSGVAVGAMLASAWYLDQRTVIKVPMDFQGPVVFEGALLTNNTLDSTRLEKLQRQLISAITHHNYITKNLSVLYHGTCSKIEPLYKQLEHAIYEADYFKAVYEDLLPHHRHASDTFHAFNTTFLVVSWEDRCETVWYHVEANTWQLIPKTVDLKFRAHQWLFLGGTAQEVYVAAAASGDREQCGVVSAIWKITNTAITKHSSLMAGQRLSMFTEGRQVTLRVHAPEGTAVYKLDLLSGGLSSMSTLLSAYDLYTTTLTQQGQTVSFRSLAGHGVLLVEDYKGEEVEAEKSIDDAVFLQEGGRLYLLLAVTREQVYKDEFLLELHSVDVATRTLTWESVHRMAARTRLTPFFAGSRTTGAYIVVALRESHTPLVYSLVGATLKEFASLSTPRVSWVEYMAVPSPVTPHFPDHYLLLGQHNRTYVLTQLVMRGGAVPHLDHVCDTEELYAP